MKVVQINTECGRGSTGRIAVAISKLLTQRGAENYILYSANHRSDYPLGRMMGSKAGLRLHQMQARLFGDQGFHSRFSTQQMIRELRQLQPDLIVLHNVHGYYLNVGLLFRFLKEYNKPVVWLLHDCWAFTGHCAHYTMAGCGRWRKGCGGCPQKSAYPYSLFFDRSKALYQRKRALFAQLDKLTLVTPSRWLAGEVKQSFLKNKEVCVIPNGINTQAFCPTDSDFRQKHQIGDKVMILGVANTWTNAKGMDVFIEAAKQLDRDRYALVMVGTDDAVDAVLPDGVISIHRTTDSRELAEIYTAADVFFNPTRQDTFPTVNMEALACGTPVAAFQTGGSTEVIDDKCGAALSENNAEQAIEYLRGVPRKSKQTAARCASRATDFDENKCFEMFVDLCFRKQLGDNEC